MHQVCEYPAGILTGPEIERKVAEGDIVIYPYDPKYAGPNSYDVRLGDTLRVYPKGAVLDYKKKTPTEIIKIDPFTGYKLEPGRLYLGHTFEHIECNGLVPWIDGRSSVGRLGVTIHVTAGRGDDGFRGQLTLEMCVLQSREWCDGVILYPHETIGQLSFFTAVGQRRKYQGRYQDSIGPIESFSWK